MGSGRQLLYRRNRASPLIDLIDATGNESALRVGGAIGLAYRGPRSSRSAIAQGRRRMSSSPNQREEIEMRMNRKERRTPRPLLGAGVRTVS